MHLAIDATHFESCDAAKPSEKKEPAPPKKTPTQIKSRTRRLAHGTGRNQSQSVNL